MICLMGAQIREGATLGASPAYCKILYQCAFNISTLFDRWQQWCGLLLSVLHQLVEWWCLQPRKHSKHLFRCSSLSACRNLWLDAEDQKYFFRWACLMQAPGRNTPLIRFFISYDLFCVEWDVKPQLNQSINRLPRICCIWLMLHVEVRLLDIWNSLSGELTISVKLIHAHNMNIVLLRLKLFLFLSFLMSL